MWCGFWKSSQHVNLILIFLNFRLPTFETELEFTGSHRSQLSNEVTHKLVSIRRAHTVIGEGLREVGLIGAGPLI